MATTKDKVESCFVKEGLQAPPGFKELFLEVEEGAAGRRRIYGRLYQIIKESGLLKGKTRVVWPLAIRTLVRDCVEREEGEQPAGSYDHQHEDREANYYISMEEMAGLDWHWRQDSRPKDGGKAPRRKRN